MMKSMALGLAVIAGLSLSAPSAFAADAKGTWQRSNGTARIQIADCGSALCGNLVWLKTPRKDTENPDPALRTRNLVGSQTILGMKPSGDDTWKGKVYNAEDGRTYSGKMKLISANELKLEGCVLGGLICKGETWSRIK
ncbi:DUF2147 domain-containing protein [Pseudovibrio sp. SPO723]|uniref:DUF2147 domain-containing protein n=1 Tax=Nesiotobacter zosterae TaxID=392721 RepID=UPI0029C53C3C|nr:DUF2147 domain-containing protein [Pseudovibrio sp. SPO723]MDX5594436.1 DUF2147 domain-containing protein [Pseudovibrio sp. SPO723]